MLSARFHFIVDAPIDRVWAVLIDHEGYARFPHVQSARLLRRGQDLPGGVGAEREVRVGGITFVERIVACEPPHLLEYKIVESRPLKLNHELGRMQLSARDGRTVLDWVTTFEVAVPIVGGLLTYVTRFLMQRTFLDILNWLKKDLERAAQG